MSRIVGDQGYVNMRVAQGYVQTREDSFFCFQQQTGTSLKYMYTTSVGTLLSKLDVHSLKHSRRLVTVDFFGTNPCLFVGIIYF